MVKLKHSEMRTIDDAFAMGSGYVLDFSNKTFAEFFDDEFRIDIYAQKYDYRGGSKANHLRAFIETEDDYTVVRVLRRLWEHREALPMYQDRPETEGFKKRLFELLSKIEGAGAVPRTDAIDRFTRDETLEELVAAIERDIAANKPVAALDRLHTYCMKKFAHLLDTTPGVAWDRSDPLHSRVGKYLKALEKDHALRDVSRQIIRNAIGIFEKFNHVRNNDSLAHDNELPNYAEARFIFDSITAILRFIKSIEATRFGL
jgi:hypothetical protein